MSLHIPKTSRRTLLLIAALFWTVAGGVLLLRGSIYFKEWDEHRWTILSGSIIMGILFYVLVFSKISLKHTNRIISLDPNDLHFFSFFSLKSYFLMAIMIGSGILLRKSGVIPLKYLAIIYITMGIPLFLSAIRFYRRGFSYRE